jgi:hypothetical protein
MKESEHFISRRLVCRSSDSSYQLHFLAVVSLRVLNLLIWHAYTWYYYATLLEYCILVVALYNPANSSSVPAMA